jgi:hypothetical protein
MFQLGDSSCLALKPITSTSVQGSGGQHFEGNRPLSLGVESLKDFTHCALTYFFNDFVPGQLL